MLALLCGLVRFLLRCVGCAAGWYEGRVAMKRWSGVLVVVVGQDGIGKKVGGVDSDDGVDTLALAVAIEIEDAVGRRLRRRRTGLGRG
jgi:hypothetical protein